MLRRISRNAPKHDAGEHGAQQKGETAGDSLDACKRAAGWSANHREPNVTVTEILGSLHEEQIARLNKKMRTHMYSMYKSLRIASKWI